MGFCSYPKEGRNKYEEMGVVRGGGGGANGGATTVALLVIRFPFQKKPSPLMDHTCRYYYWSEGCHTNGDK